MGREGDRLFERNDARGGERRPDLFAAARLGAEDEALVREIEDEARAGGPGALDKSPAVIHK